MEATFTPDDDARYICDNGRILCAAHLGVTAARTGRDISGQRIMKAEMPHACETCRARKERAS